MPATRNAVPVALTPAEIAARFDADELARKARIVRADERHAARMQASARSSRTLELAVADGWRIDKAADPVDDAATDISVALAAEVAASDPGLLTFTR